MSDEIAKPKGSEKALSPRNYNVPVRLNDMSIFDGAFTFMKQRFGEEMRRVEDEMNKFSKNLLKLHEMVADTVRGESTTYRADVPITRELSPSPTQSSNFDNITNSPLVEGEGEDKMLRLQFDVSQFEPNEVFVKILNNLLIVSAQHREKTDSSAVYNEYYREFMLPYGTDPENVESALSKDGILIVRTPLHLNAIERSH